MALQQKPSPVVRGQVGWKICSSDFPPCSQSVELLLSNWQSSLRPQIFQWVRESHSSRLCSGSSHLISPSWPHCHGELLLRHWPHPSSRDEEAQAACLLRAKGVRSSEWQQQRWACSQDRFLAASFFFFPNQLGGSHWLTASAGT